MTQPGGHVEVVIRTASSLLVGGLGAREAVTILATQTPRALARAAQLAEADPARARDFADVVRALEAALAALPATGSEIHDLAAVRQDLTNLANALDATPA